MPVPDQVTWVSVFVICRPAHASLAPVGPGVLWVAHCPLEKPDVRSPFVLFCIGYRSFNFPMMMVMILGLFIE